MRGDDANHHQGHMLMLANYCLITVFVMGLVIGSFLNVAIARLPLEKSLIWPGSRCGSCFQAVRWYDNIPLVSYLWLRGRCRTCGTKFSSQYFWVELATGLGLAGLFYVEVIKNVHQWPIQPWQTRGGLFPWHFWAGFLFHALLFALLMVASVCDLNGREIPIQLTLTGTLLGLIGSTLLAWPFPWSPAEAAPRLTEVLVPGQASLLAAGEVIKEGVQPWPLWLPLPPLLAPGGNWQTGLATGLAGALLGTFMLRAIRFLFGAGLGKEALGLGDADLMMMAGAFLGWQAVVVGFFLSVFPALFFGVMQFLVRRDNSLPFGPSLACGTMIALLCWRWIAPSIQPLFFWGQLMLFLALGAGVFFFLTSFVLRGIRFFLGSGST